MYLKLWKYLDNNDDPGSTPPADPPPSDPPPSDPPQDPKWQDNWRETYAGEDKKKMERLGRYATPAAAFDALLSLQTKIGTGELRIALPKDATPEQVQTWRDENGIPAAPDKYDIKFGGDGLPEADKDVISRFLETVHSKNVNNDQAKATVEWYYQEVARQTEERQQKDQEFAQQAQDALRAEWGTDYRANINMIGALLETAPTEVKSLIEGGRLANGDPFMAHPGAMQWLVGMARQINPVTTVIPNAGANIGSAIDDEIKSIETLMQTDRKAYNADEKKQARLRELYTAREKLK